MSPPVLVGLPVVVALTSPDGNALPGRSDSAMATAYLSSAQFPWSIIVDSGDAKSICAQVSAAGRVVMAAHELSVPLMTCLQSHDAIVIAPATTGTVVTKQGGGVLALRRGDVASVTDTARWAHRNSQLRGRVGLVADATRRSALSLLPTALTSAGINLVSTAWLGGGSATSTVKAVQQFGRARVDAVVFALPVSEQRNWVQQAGALRSHFSYVVTDVDDGITNETYPASFDGSVAHTSLRASWYARAHGATPQQQDCSDRWTSQVTPGVVLPGETGPLYTWCEEVSLLDQGLLSPTVGTVGLMPTLSRLALSSPLTSDLAPLVDAVWGPTADAVLTWRAGCECWTEAVGFTAR